MESPEEFFRLRAQLRPYVPAEKPLLPGVRLGPLKGTAMGSFGSFFLHSLWANLMRNDALARLKAEGVRGLSGFPTELRFRQDSPPDLVELEILPHGGLHPECTSERPPACPRCGLTHFRFPDEPILDEASLPSHTDLFRLSDFETILIGTERFVEAVRRLGLDDIDIREVPVR
ncbi:hypothetical protein MEBOL_003082 [Melittangium boletus DSM 14713]|uniref:Uncharacterized protein n=1 Tax=Melittangium boletus DSM 14713 TaxID=1294270 RepID=A0A250IEQ8_9BACT|nr:hypothetical protein MEBOL_003082 [Melittangium boletus DSM 14713]